MQLQSASSNVPAWLRCLMLNNPALPTQIFKNMVTNVSLRWVYIDYICLLIDLKNVFPPSLLICDYRCFRFQNNAFSAFLSEHPHSEDESSAGPSSVNTEPGTFDVKPLTKESHCQVSPVTTLGEPSLSPSAQLLSFSSDIKQEMYEQHSNTEHDVSFLVLVCVIVVLERILLH